MASGVNGPLLEILAKEIGWIDAESINFFRKGAPLIGELKVSGVGEPSTKTPKVEQETMFENIEERNLQVRPLSCNSYVVLSHRGVHCRARSFAS